MKILYLGVPAGSSNQRANALRRIGHEVTLINPEPFVRGHRLVRKFHWEAGSVTCQKAVTEGVLSGIRELGPNGRFDLVWVDSGRLVGPKLVQALRSSFGKIVNYNLDDPFGKRDRFSWLSYLRAVPFYDLVVVVRKENVEEARRRGAKDVILLKRAADDVDHIPHPVSEEQRARLSSEVLFLGTWFPERGPFMRELLSKGVPLTIYGDRWDRAPEWPEIKRVWKGNSLYADDYAIGIQCSKIALGLLSKGNRDLHTQRSSEIPAIGGLLCAERTSEHQEMYVDGEEAVFWDDAAECASVCKKLLEDDALRIRIRDAGFARVRKNGSFNQPLVQAILDRLAAGPPSAAS